MVDSDTFLTTLYVMIDNFCVLLTMTYMRSDRLFVGPRLPGELLHEQWQTLRHG